MASISWKYLLKSFQSVGTLGTNLKDIHMNNRLFNLTILTSFVSLEPNKKSVPSKMVTKYGFTKITFGTSYVPKYKYIVLIYNH